MTTKDTLQILDSGYPPLTALTINNYSMPTTAGTTGQFLKSNGANAQLSWASGTPELLIFQVMQCLQQQEQMAKF